MGRKGKKKENQKPTTTDKIQEKRDVFPAFCDKHPKHAIEMFCVDCDKVVCVICQATEHKSGDHTKIITIEEASTDCAESKEFLEYEDKLKTVFTRETKTLADNDEVNIITNQLKEETESLIKKHKQDMIDLIEKHHKILYEKNQLKYKQSQKRLLSVNEQLCKNKNKTAEIRQEIHDKKESGQNVALFIAMKKSQDNLRQIEIELEENEKLNFVERYEFQAGHMVKQLLEEEKEFGDLLETASSSPKVPPHELKPRGVLVLPCQSKAGVEAEEAEEDELDGYEPVGQIATAVSNDDQKTRQKSSPRRGSTQSLNISFTEETNEQEGLSGDNFKIPNTEYMDPDADDEQFDSRMPPNFADALPIANKPSPGTIQRRRNTWHESYDTVQLWEIEQTHTPGSPILSTEREQAAHPDPVFHVQSGQDMIPVPQQKHEKYIALYDFEPRVHGEIEIKTGQLVTVLEKYDDWFHGEASGRYGLFPVSYVQKAENKDPVAPPIAKKPSTDTILRRRSMLEIRTDTITTHYVRRNIVQTQLPERDQSAHQDPIFPIQSCQEMIPVPQQKPEKYIAMWDYEPRSQDEIELKEGNVVAVLEKCNQEWFLAEASGRQGYIPVNYVRKAEDNYVMKAEDNYVRKAEDNYVRKAEDNYVRKAENNFVRKAEDKKDSGGDLTNELEAALLRRRATLDISTSEEK